MFAFRELVNAHKDELAALITREHGKVLADARGEVTRGLEVIEFACGLGHLLKGENTPQVSGGVDSHSMRMPLGVVAGITPFNFPMMVPLWMAPVALACGNAFILKPSEQDPSPSMRLAELLAEAGLPDGVFSVVHGDKEAVDAILHHPGISGVSFVGSTPVAQYIYETGTANGKRVQALGGAKNHAVVLPDADLDLTADGLVSAAYGSAGQRCMAVSVAVTVGDVAEPLLAKVKERIEKLTIGPGTDAELRHGPARLRAPPREGGRARRRRRRGGRRSGRRRARPVVDGHEGGYFLGPCVFDRVKPGMRVYDEEIFGPVLVVVRADSYPEALELRERQPVRQRRGDLHLRRRRGAAVRAAGDRGDDRRQRADPGADGLPLVRRLEVVAVRRPPRAWPGRCQVLHARQGGHDAAGPTRRRTPASTWASRRRLSATSRGTRSSTSRSRSPASRCPWRAPRPPRTSAPRPWRWCRRSSRRRSSAAVPRPDRAPA